MTTNAVHADPRIAAIVSFFENLIRSAEESYQETDPDSYATRLDLRKEIGRLKSAKDLAIEGHLNASLGKAHDFTGLNSPHQETVAALLVTAGAWPESPLWPGLPLTEVAQSVSQRAEKARGAWEDARHKEEAWFEAEERALNDPNTSDDERMEIHASRRHGGGFSHAGSEQSHRYFLGKIKGSSEHLEMRAEAHPSLSGNFELQCGQNLYRESSDPEEAGEMKILWDYITLGTYKNVADLTADAERFAPAVLAVEKQIGASYCEEGFFNTARKFFDPDNWEHNAWHDRNNKVLAAIASNVAPNLSTPRPVVHTLENRVEDTTHADILVASGVARYASAFDAEGANSQPSMKIVVHLSDGGVEATVHADRLVSEGAARYATAEEARSYERSFSQDDARIAAAQVSPPELDDQQLQEIADAVVDQAGEKNPQHRRRAPEIA